MAIPGELTQYFTEFEQFPVGHESRKKIIWQLEAEIKTGSLAVSQNDMELLRADENGVARIFCYLVEQHGNLPFSRARLFSAVENERTRRLREEWSNSASNQPLYYAIRAYVERFQQFPNQVQQAVSDWPTFKSIREDLSKNAAYEEEKDIQGQIARLEALIKSHHNNAPNNQSESNSDLPTTRQLVLIVPGIRDRGGDWGVVLDELLCAGFDAKIVTWGEYFGLPRFLVPAPWFRRVAIKNLRQRILEAIDSYTDKQTKPLVSFIAHSFGSYILCYLLRKDSLIKAHRIIICGSVLPRSFGFADFATRFKGPVVNDVGKLDRYPFVASCVTFGYGTVGTYGYANANVLDRFHNGMDHSDFSKPGFCKEWWIPVLQSSGRRISTPSPNLPAEESTVRRSVYRILQNLKWVLILLLVLSLLPQRLPCQYQVTLGIRSTPCDLGVEIKRSVDFSKLRCEDGKRVYSFVAEDELKFSRHIDYYSVQSERPPKSVVIVKDGKKRELELLKERPVVSEAGWFRRMYRYPVHGDSLNLTYEFSGTSDKNDDEWGFAISSSLPILKFVASASLPNGKTVAGKNLQKQYHNDFPGCLFESGSTPVLTCSEPLNNEVNVSQRLYWNWNVFEGC